MTTCASPSTPGACATSWSPPRATFSASSASTPAFGAVSEAAHTGVTLGDVASRNFTVVGEDEIAFDVIRRMWRKNAIMAVVVRGRGVPRGSDVVGVITKEHVADSVADSIKAYPQ